MSMYSGIGSFAKKYQRGGAVTEDGGGAPVVTVPGQTGGSTSTTSTLPSYASVGDDGRIVIAPTVTNYQFVQLMKVLGYFDNADPYDYEWLLRHFAPGGKGGGDDTWLAQRYNDAERNLDVSAIADMGFTDQNKGVFTRLFEAVNTGSQAGGFLDTTNLGAVNQPGSGGTGATDGTSNRPVFIGQPPTGGTPEQPYYSLSDILVTPFELADQVNMYDVFQPYPVGGFETTDPYSGTVTQSYPYSAPSGLPGITPVTTSATPVGGTVGEPTTSTPTTPTGGTGAPGVDTSTTGTTGTTDTDTAGTTDTDTAGTTDTGTTDTGTTGTTSSAPVSRMPSYDVIANAITNVEGVDPGPRKYDFDYFSGQERSYQRQRAREHTNQMFRHYLGRGIDNAASDYYAPRVLQAFDMGGERGRQAYFDIVEEIRNSEEGQLFAQSGRNPLALTMDYYATPEPYYAGSMANVDFSQEYLNPADFAGVNDYIHGKRGILQGQKVKQNSLRNLSMEDFMNILAGQSGTGAYGGDLIYDPDQGIIYSGISDRMDDERRQEFMNILASRRNRNNAMASGIDPSLLTDTEKLRARHLYGGYGTTSTRIGDTQYFVNDDGTISALDVQDIDYDFTPGFAEGGIVDVYSGDMANLQTTGEGIESFLNPERSKATLRRNLAKLAPRPTAPVMQQGIMPMAR